MPPIRSKPFEVSELRRLRLFDLARALDLLETENGSQKI